MRVIGVLWLLCVVLAVGCASASGEPTAGGAAAAPTLGEPITLKPGEKAVFAAERLEVRFDRVISDSRCPKGAQCIVAGEAVIRLTVTLPDKTNTSIEVKTAPTDSGTTVGSYRVSVSDLQPLPTVGGAVREADYRLTLLVAKQ